jgi:hypothetical protein
MVSGAKSLLTKEFDEINEYVRSTCQLTMAWYTFFVTGNLIASGWLVSGELKGSAAAPPYLLLVSSLFIFINVLSLVGFNNLIPYVKEQDVRLLEITEKLKTLSGVDVRVASPLPKALYVKLLRFYLVSLCAFSVFWLWLFVLNIIRRENLVIDWGKTASVAQVVEAAVVVVSVILIWFHLRQQTKLAKVSNSRTLGHTTETQAARLEARDGGGTPTTSVGSAAPDDITRPPAKR